MPEQGTFVGIGIEKPVREGGCVREVAAGEEAMRGDVVFWYVSVKLMERKRVVGKSAKVK